MDCEVEKVIICRPGGLKETSLQVELGESMSRAVFESEKLKKWEKNEK